MRDFGDPPLEPALRVLLRSLEREAALRPIGRFLMKMHLQDLLATRLQLGQLWNLRAEAMNRQCLNEPVFIVGMPRSGSTFLHELLASDPNHRAPRVWEVMYPLAAAGDEPGAREKCIRKAEACLWWFRRLAPGVDRVYPMRAQTPHECVAIHSYTFLSEEFVSTCNLPSYGGFLRQVDLTPAYRWQRRFLQHLQLGTTNKRWVLKSPDHVRGLESLFAVFPDAYLIQTHRNPIEVLKSSAALTQVLRGFYGRACDPGETLAQEASTLAENTDRFIQFRDRHPELKDRIIDVKYSELVANPLGVIKAIYARLALPLDEPQLDRLRRLASSRSQYAGRRASAAPFNAKLRAEAEFRMFERYCLRFGLQFQGAEPE